MVRITENIMERTQKWNTADLMGLHNRFTVEPICISQPYFI